MIAEDLFALQTWMARDTATILFHKYTTGGRTRMGAAGKVNDDSVISYISSKKNTVQGLSLKTGFMQPSRYFVMIPRGKVIFDSDENNLKIRSSAAFVYPLFAKFMLPEELYMPIAEMLIDEIYKLDHTALYNKTVFSRRLNIELDQRSDFDDQIRAIQNSLNNRNCINHNMRVYLAYPMRDRMPRGCLYNNLRSKELDQLALAGEMGCMIDNIGRLKAISLANGCSREEYQDNGYKKAVEIVKNNFFTDFDFVIQKFMENFNGSCEKPVEKFSF